MLCVSSYCSSRSSTSSPQDMFDTTGPLYVVCIYALIIGLTALLAFRMGAVLSRGFQCQDCPHLNDENRSAR